MKIAFITGGLEPGRDGVGDYACQLAGELIRQGHPSVIVGLNDANVSEARFDPQEMEGTSIPALRLPGAMPWPDRVTIARKWLDDFNPDWVSLQLVAYGFHPKGLVCGLAEKLAPMLAGQKFHVMFHEIWLCKELGWGWRQCAIGALQRHYIKNFVQTTKPDVVHTSNGTYAALLNRSGISAKKLELFGNVPVLSQPGTAWIESQLQTVFGGEFCRDAFWFFGFFGALHSQWPPEPLLTRLHRAAQAADKKPVLLSIGRIGGAGENLWNQMAKNYSDRFIFLRLGEQPAERISEYLSFLDCGIATTPRSLIGKSGTVISMLEHGLPVIVNRDDAPGATTGIVKSEPLIMPCDAHLETRLHASLKKGSCGSRRPQVARDFAFALERASHYDLSSMSNLASVLPSSFKPWLWQRLSRLMHLQYRLPSGMRIHIASYSDWCIYNDIFVAGEYDQAIGAALDKAKTGQTFRVVDLGANVGFFTLRVLDLIARRKIHFDRIECLLVEASARLRPDLHRHFDKIDRKELTAKIVIGLVGQKTGEARLALKASECMNQVGEEPAAASCRVPYYNLNDALDETAEINLLKCDIEGSERDFLENYPELLRHAQVAVFEFHDPICPASVGVPKVMNAGFTANHVLRDQDDATTVFFER